MTNVQLYFTIGIPTFTVLVSLMIGIFQLNHVVNQLNLRFTSLENRMTSLESRLDSRMSVIEGDIKTIVRIIGDLDVRLARLEERTAR
jgi:high-affinity nickel permease